MMPYWEKIDWNIRMAVMRYFISKLSRGMPDFEMGDDDEIETAVERIDEEVGSGRRER